MRNVIIRIEVLSGRNLQSNRKSGVADPYCQLRIGKLKQVTKVIPKTLSPFWNQEFIFRITPALLDGNLIISVWDKDLFISNFLGFLEFSVSNLLHSSNNNPEWHPLLGRSPKEVVFGDICVRISIEGDMDSSFRLITESISRLSLSRNASLISSENPSDLVFFNHTVNVAEPEEAQPSPGPESELSDNLTQSTISNYNNIVPLDHDLAGLLLIDGFN
jgi:C2 domain